MARTRVKVHRDGLRDVFAQWARNDGVSRGQRVAAAMASAAPVESGALSASHGVEVEEHKDRSVVQVGSDLDYALVVAVRTGYMTRALDAAGGT